MLMDILLWGSLFGTILLGTLAIISDRMFKKKHAYGRLETVKKESKVHQKLYIFFSKNRLSRRYIREIRKRYEIIADYNEHVIRKKVVNLFVGILVISVVTIITFATISRSFISIIYGGIIVYFLAESVIDIYVVKLTNKIMADQIEFNNKVKHNYYEFKVIEDALYFSAEEMAEEKPEIATQGMKLFDILTSKNVEMEMTDYYDTSPNRFLQMLLGLCYISKEYGDTIDENGRSLLVSNISSLNDEIRIEVFKREKLNYLLRTLNVITLLPILFISPIKNWAASSFYPLQEFYEGNIGAVFEVLMYCIVFFSYVVVRKIQQVDSTKPIRKNRLEENEYVKRLLKWIVPLRYTKRRFNKEKLINESGENITINGLYTRKILFSIGALILSFGIIVSIHNQTIDKILYDPDIDAVRQNYFGGGLEPEELQSAKDITEYDRAVIQQLNGDTDIDRITLIVSEDSGVAEAEVTAVVNRIKVKADIVNGEYFKWYELLICLASAIVGFTIPDIMLMIQRNIKRIEMENEVSVFQTIILMLMHIERINVEEILEWMTKYSDIFKPQLEQCLTEYDAGADVALGKLKDSVEYKGFKELIESLESASNDLSIIAAFDELESEKSYFFKMREETNQRTIEKKRGVGNIVGFLPIYALIALYLVIPMIYVSITELQSFYEDLQTF